MQHATQDEAQESEDVPLFERQRKANIARNKERLASLGIQTDKPAGSLPQGTVRHGSDGLSCMETWCVGTHHAGACIGAACTFMKEMSGTDELLPRRRMTVWLGCTRQAAEDLLMKEKQCMSN